MSSFHILSHWLQQLFEVGSIIVIIAILRVRKLKLKGNVAQNNATT